MRNKEINSGNYEEFIISIFKYEIPRRIYEIVLNNLREGDFNFEGFDKVYIDSLGIRIFDYKQGIEKIKEIHKISLYNGKKEIKLLRYERKECMNLLNPDENSVEENVMMKLPWLFKAKGKEEYHLYVSFEKYKGFKNIFRIII